MKTLTTLPVILVLAIIINICMVEVSAQVPDKFSFQAVVRDNSGKLIASEQIGVRISIIQQINNSPTPVYIESHNPTSNANGLISLEIGAGDIVSGVFSEIDWSAGIYFIETAIDWDNGTNYLLISTSQLLSVPYALHAKTAEHAIESDPLFVTSPAGGISENDIDTWNGKQDLLTAGTGIQIADNVISISSGSDGETRYIGELYGGGIIAALWKENGQEHGLIVTMTNVGEAIPWSNVTTAAIGAGAQSLYDGLSNTNAITAQNGHINSAAKACADYLNSDTGTGVFSDWYLPAVKELNECFNNSFVLNTILEPVNRMLYGYWNSTETEDYVNQAWSQHFFRGVLVSSLKENNSLVRCVRRF